MLFLVVAAMATAGPTDTWNMGGGRAWMIPPKLGDDSIREQQYALRRALSRPETKAERKAELREAARIEQNARRGDVRAMRVTGFLLLNGVIVAQDQAAALGWFYEAALRGDVPSMFVLGCAFEGGIGVAADPQLAAYWRTRASKLGASEECQ